MFSDDQLIAISGLQHWLYCPRQWGLIHLEQAWAENRFTAEGRVMHENAHSGADETRRDLRITRGMPVVSERLGMVGQCDVVEFHADGKVLPVEYKRGKPKAHRADEVQLCAQGMCLEEMMDRAIAGGFLFYGEKRRRTEVEFDEALRNLVRSTVEQVRECFAGGVTPLGEYDPHRCDACSLIDVCQPSAMRFKKGAAAWFAANLRAQM